MKRVLLIDDESKVRKCYRRVLESRGYAVAEAAGGEEAAKLLVRRASDVVLLDVRMPGLDGIFVNEMISLLRPGAKVIISSVLPLGEQRRMFPGADGYFDKSWGTDALLEKVEEVLSDAS